MQVNEGFVEWQKEMIIMAWIVMPHLEYVNRTHDALTISPRETNFINKL
jgi:hypothetical protein